MKNLFSLIGRRLALRAGWAGLLVVLLLALLPGQARAQSISGFSPASGYSFSNGVAGINDEVVITGGGLANVTSVRFNGTQSPYFTANAAGTQLTVALPAGATSGPITVVTSTGTATSANSFTVAHTIDGGDITTCSGIICDNGGPNRNYTPLPLIPSDVTTISPATAGSKVSLSFTQFDVDPVDARLYIFDGPDTNAPQIGPYYSGLNRPPYVVATNPTGQLTLRFTSYANSYTTSRPGFTATISCVAGVPTISSFTPTNGPVGTNVVITGLNFTGTTAVAFNGVSAPGFIVNSDTQITVPVPAGATTGLITVVNGNGTGRSVGSFTVQPLTISSFAPTSGTVGTSVVITGANFTGTTAVRFNGTLAPGFVINSSTQITVPVPAGATTGPISMTIPGGTGNSITSFTMLPLTISSFSPTTGAAGTSVVITGLNFTGTTAVAFNGAAAPGFVVNSNTQITVPVPAGATTGPIAITNALGTGTSATSFTLAPPTISSFSPTSGLVGASVVITGTSFLQASAVSFNGTTAPGFVVNSDTQITVPVPAGATTGPISVTTPSGTGTSTNSFTVQTPTISGFSPTGGLAGTGVVITGTYFTGATAVRFNGTAAAGFTVTSDTQITVSVPAGATTGPITVTTPTGTATSTSSFTVPVPTISNFSPANGTSGTSVVITGTNFTGTTAVRFNGLAASGFVVNSNTQLTVSVPAGATTGPITVTAGTTATSATSFVTDNYWVSSAAITACSGTLYDANGADNVTAQDNTTTLSPATAGAKVRLAFTQFSLNTGTLYLYDGPGTTAPLLGQYSAATAPSTVTATNPTGQLTLRFVSGTPTSNQPGFAATISCVSGVPTISGFTPTSGGQSVTVTITGVNFTGTTAVAFNGATAPGFVVNSDTQITMSVPAGASTGPIAVTNGNGTGTSAGSFTVLAPAISSFSPTSGGQGVAVTITGMNFSGATAVRFNGALAPGFVVNSDARITVSVPAGASTGPIAVTNGIGTSTSAGSFTVLMPVISSFTPTSGTGGTSVVITGANFTGTTAVAFNATAAASFVVNSDTQITASVAAGTLSGLITVTNGVGTGTSASNFVTGSSQTPVLTAVSPARNLPTAPQGANVVLTFSQPMAPATAGNVRVFGAQRGGQLVRGGNATATGNTITVAPARAFAPGERVMVTVPATVQSTAGYPTLARVHEFTAAAGQATGTFLNTPTVLTMGATSVAVAVGDLNGDGLLDLATSDFYGTGTAPTQYSGVVVRLGIGNGQFGTAITYRVTSPGDLTLGDVDGDGDLDIVVGGSPTNSGPGGTNYYVTTLVNDGSGRFPSTRTTYTGANPTHAVLGDLDGDGDLDLLTSANTVSFNNGSGTFTGSGAVFVANATADVAVGDVDGDGDLDALIANGNQVSVRLNDGSGSFGGGSDVPMGSFPTKLTVGDVDGDGDLDLATTSLNDGLMSVRLNLGNGTFGGGADYPVSFLPQTLALGDLDGDGDLDLVATSLANGIYSTPGQAAVRFNNGRGTFSGGSDFATGGNGPSVALGDMDGDGSLDLVMSHNGRATSYSGYPNYIYTFASAELYIRFNTALSPTLAGFSPQSGPAGTLVTITGTNLNTVRGVRFGSSSALAPITVLSGTSLTVQVPVLAASGPLTLTTASGQVLTTATAFTYTPRPAGLAATLSPAGPLDACSPRTLTATATSPGFAVGSGLNGNVFGLATRPNGKHLLAGPFVSYNGATVNRMVQLNPDGSRDATFATTGGFDDVVQCLALQPDGKAILAGSFLAYGNTAATRIIRLNPDGSPDASFVTGSGFNGTVQCVVVQPDGQILVGGEFTSYNGATGQNGLIRLNPNGSRDVSFVTGTGVATNTGGRFYPQNLALQADGKVLMAGLFTSYNGTTGLTGIARLTANGAYDTSFSASVGAGSDGQTIVQLADGKVLVGGSFNRGAQSPLVRLNADGTPDASFVTGSGFNGLLNAVVPQPDGQLLVAGQFTTYNGATQNHLVRLNTDGSVDTTFPIGTAGFDLAARCLSLQPDGSLVVAGNFTTYRGVASSHLIRLLPNADPSTTPRAVNGTTFTFAPGNTATTGTLVTSTPGSYSVVASLNGETSAPSNTVTLTPCTTVSVSVLSVPAELPGLPVTITGTGFAPGSTVSIGGVGAAVTYVSPTTLTAVVPATAAPGSSSVQVTTAGVSNVGGPAFTVLAVYDGGMLDACAPAVPATASVGDGVWHYLLASNGQVVAAYNYTGTSLGNLSAEVMRANPAAAVRQDAGSRYYLGRNWHLTASAGRFDGRTVQLRFYGLNAEQARLQVADPTATLANLKATQYSGPNEDCQLANNDATGERRTLAAPATSQAGTAWFMAQLAVADHFSEFYLTGSPTPLPVELLSFTAEKRGTTVALAWATASEKNSDRFEVERSRDGRSFERIGQVAGAGSSTSARHYDFLDSRYPGETNQLYYRLRQVDMDGTATYSPVRVVTLGGLATLALFPNPTRAAATLTGAAANAEVQVLDALGRKVLVTTTTASGTATLVLPAGLPTGVYVVRVDSKALRLTIE